MSLASMTSMPAAPVLRPLGQLVIDDRREMTGLLLSDSWIRMLCICPARLSAINTLRVTSKLKVPFPRVGVPYNAKQS